MDSFKGKGWPFNIFLWLDAPITSGQHTWLWLFPKFASYVLNDSSVKKKLASKSVKKLLYIHSHTNNEFRTLWVQNTLNSFLTIWFSKKYLFKWKTVVVLLICFYRTLQTKLFCHDYIPFFVNDWQHFYFNAVYKNTKLGNFGCLSSTKYLHI